MCSRTHSVDVGKVPASCLSLLLHLPRELHHDASAHLARPLARLWLPDAFSLPALGDHCLASHTAEHTRLCHVLGSAYCPSFMCFSCLFAFELWTPCASSSIPGKAKLQTLAWVPTRCAYGKRVRGVGEEHTHQDPYVKTNSQPRSYSYQGLSTTALLWMVILLCPFYRCADEDTKCSCDLHKVTASCVGA